MAWKKILLEGYAASLSDVAPVNASHAVAAAGDAATASRQNHKHDIDEGVVGTMVAIDGGAAALGSADAVPHLDHKHTLGALAVNLDFNQKQAVGLVAHATATPPNAATEVEGQIYYDSTALDQHLYVWVP